MSQTSALHDAILPSRLGGATGHGAEASAFNRPVSGRRRAGRCAGNPTPTPVGGPMSGKSKRGFASMDPARQREIASKGGRAAHAKGTAHEWSTDEARRAGRKGGEVVSRDRAHMEAIGRAGGEARGRAPQLAALQANGAAATPRFQDR